MKFKKFGLASLLILFSASLLVPKSVSAETSVFVNDNADILSPETEQQIIELNENTFKSFPSFPQLAVYTIEELPDGHDIDSYTVDLFEQLGVGQEEYDNGLLFVLSEQDRAYRLEVGYGMEHVIVDGMHQDIVDDTAMQHLSENNFDSAINEIVDNIEEVVVDSEYGTGNALTIEEREQIAAEQAAIKKEKSDAFKSKMMTVLGGVVSVGGISSGAGFLWNRKRKRERQEAIEQSRNILSKEVTKRKANIDNYLIGLLNGKIADGISNSIYKFKILQIDLDKFTKELETIGLTEFNEKIHLEDYQDTVFRMLSDSDLSTKDEVLNTKNVLMDKLSKEDFYIFSPLLISIDVTSYFIPINNQYKEFVKEQVNIVDSKYLSGVDYITSKAHEDNVESLHKRIKQSMTVIDSMTQSLQTELERLKGKVLNADNSWVNNNFRDVESKYVKDPIGFSADLLLQGLSASNFSSTLLKEYARIYVEQAVNSSHVSKYDASRFLSNNSNSYVKWFETETKRDIAYKYEQYHARKELERAEEARREAARRAEASRKAAIARSNNSSGSSGGSSFGGGSSGGGGFSGSF